MDPWVWVLGCGCLGVGAWVWVLGSVGGGRDGDGQARDGAGWIGIVAVGWRESPPWASPSRNRIAGSGVIDRPTFRLPGSQMRAGLGWGKPHSPRTPHKMARMPLGAHRML